MINSEDLGALLKLIEDDEKFILFLKKVFKDGIKTIQETPELQEELLDYDVIYQCHLTDINFDYWLKISECMLECHEGVNDGAVFHVYLTKEKILAIMKGDMTGIDAYMKGHIKFEGSLTQGLQYVRFFKFFFKYVQEVKAKKKK